MKLKWTFERKPFLTSRRKIYELLALLVLNIILWFFVEVKGILALLSLGYVWNWAASQEVGYVVEGKRYRFSMLKMVYNLHRLFLFPFKKLPAPLQIIPKILPAGLFWILVLNFAESELPWWPTFAGSLLFEMTQSDVYFKRTVQHPPELPPEVMP